MATNQREKTSKLVAEFCKGDDHAFSELYDLYVHALYNYGMKLTSDQELVKDCIHDVFVKVYRKRHEQLSINNFSSYLLISLKNRLLDEFRRQAFSSDNDIQDYTSKRCTSDVEMDFITDEHHYLQRASLSTKQTSRDIDVTSYSSSTPGHHTVLSGRAQIRRNLPHHADELSLCP